jgi:hypothetical protein
MVQYSVLCFFPTCINNLPPTINSQSKPKLFADDTIISQPEND